MRPALALTLAVTLVVAAGATAPADLADQVKKTWVVVEAEKDGESSSTPIDDVLTFDGSKLTVVPDENKDRKQTASYTIDESADPAHLDLMPEGMKDDSGAPLKILGLLKIEDGKLTLIFASPGGDRPTGFETKAGEGTMKAVLESQDK